MHAAAALLQACRRRRPLQPHETRNFSNLAANLRMCAERPRCLDLKSFVSLFHFDIHRACAGWFFVAVMSFFVLVLLLRLPYDSVSSG
jgi:hypothetical protein